MIAVRGYFKTFKNVPGCVFRKVILVMIGRELMVLLVVMLVISSTICLVVLASYFSALPITKKNLVTRQTQLLVSTMVWAIWVQSSACLLALCFGTTAPWLALFCFIFFYRWSARMF